MGLLLSTRRILIASTAQAWSPALPLPVSGLLPEHWYRSDQGLWQDAGITPAAADGDVVGRWEDISANADHVNQAVVANKPTLQSGVADLLNGHPVVRFDGIDDTMAGTFTTGGAVSQPYTNFVVTKLKTGFESDGLYHLAIDSTLLANEARFGKRNTNTWYMQSGVAALSGGAADDDWHIWTVFANGLTSQFWKNGVSEAGPGDAGVDFMPGLTVGSRQGGVVYWADDFTEILTYDANLSNADKNTIGTYLATRYALAYTDI